MTSSNPPLVSPRSSSLFPGRHPLNTPLARLAGAPQLKRDKSYFVHPEEVEGRLFLGFGKSIKGGRGRVEKIEADLPSFRSMALWAVIDCSTQALKVVAVNESLQVVAEAKVDFSDEIPRFG